jgi:hypothetical protein
VLQNKDVTVPWCHLVLTSSCPTHPPLICDLNPNLQQGVSVKSQSMITTIFSTVL